ncbi:MAG TPA: lysophospholipid acyltransferase family protein, partial [Candidatus Dormibacteraeota bacterium]|nr:lysophospholipid acyltransferase family protein [Candidatus Dormibacteraeota bacterium]
MQPPPAALRAGLWVASRSLRAMGRGRYALADGLGTAVYAAARQGRRRCALNHQRLDPSLSASDARRRALRSYREFMRTSFDFTWEYAMSPQTLTDRHFHTTGVDKAFAARDRHGGGIFALAHFGSWDVAAALALAREIPLVAVMRAIGTDLVTRIALWARRHQDMEVLITGNAARGLIDALRRGRFAAIICDLPERGATVDVDFCGGRTHFSVAPAWLSRKTGAPIMPVDCFREHDGRYHMVIHDPLLAVPGESDADVMQR